MKKVLLLLGGARSGKSRYAQEYAQKQAEKVLFVATATAGDEDMRQRIEQHKKDRPVDWTTLEVTHRLGKEIEAAWVGEDVLIIDCITMLVNNIFCSYDEDQFEKLEDAVLEKKVVSEISELIACMKRVEASFIIISNEVGLGLVPDNRMGRLYRDILGRANQMLAQNSEEVYLMVAGIPLRVKGISYNE
jgi:adenosylcobinamide kinase/adenosylcobinamide-phosphate guanylyltransferase